MHEAIAPQVHIFRGINDEIVVSPRSLIVRSKYGDVLRRLNPRNVSGTEITDSRYPTLQICHLRRFVASVTFASREEAEEAATAIATYALRRS